MHGMQPRADQYGRGRIITQEVEGRQKKSSSSEPPAAASAVNLKTSNVQVQDHNRSTETTDNLGSRPCGEGQPAPIIDRSDNQEQVYLLICILLSEFCMSEFYILLLLLSTSELR